MKTLVLVADAGRARLFVRATAGNFQHIMSWNSPQARHQPHQTSSDKSGSLNGSAYDPEVAAQRHAQQAFANELMAEVKLREMDFERILIAAPPRFLGDLRAHLNVAVTNKLSTLTRDLTNLKPDEVEQRLLEAERVIL